MAGKPRITAAIGDRFGKLTIIEDLGMLPLPSGSRKSHYLGAQCVCGTYVRVLQGSIKYGLTRSCGRCIRGREHGNATHGMSRTPEHQAWASMIQRCENPDNPGFPEYGGRGIKVCVRWHKFENFLADLGEKPEPKRLYSMDRLNNDGDYEPGNVRWRKAKDQSRNRRVNRWLEFRGEKKTLAEWAEIFGVNSSSIHLRLKIGMSVEEALTTPFEPVKRIDKFTDQELLDELRRRGLQP